MGATNVARKLAIFSLAACLAALSLVACRPEPVAPDDATVLILDPPANAHLSGGQVTVRSYVSYLKLVDAIGQPAVPGEGHLVYYMDVTPPVVRGESALTGTGTYFATTDKVHVWTNVPPGDHIFWVQLVSNNNTPLEPPAAVRVPVTMR
jgi:hypothetical protein